MAGIYIREIEIVQARIMQGTVSQTELIKHHIRFYERVTNELQRLIDRNQPVDWKQYD